MQKINEKNQRNLTQRPSRNYFTFDKPAAAVMGYIRIEYILR